MFKYRTNLWWFETMFYYIIASRKENSKYLYFLLYMEMEVRLLPKSILTGTGPHK